MSLPHNLFVFQTAGGVASPFLMFDSMDRNGVTDNDLYDDTSGYVSGTHGEEDGGLSAGPLKNTDLYNGTALALATVEVPESHRSGSSFTNTRIQGAHYFTIPANGYYEFCVRGASGGIGGGDGSTGRGGGYVGGTGVAQTGVRYMNKGTLVGVVVGKCGSIGGGNTNTNGAGGGGSFVFTYNGSSNTLLFASGGGGGGAGSGWSQHSSKNTTWNHANTGTGGNPASGSYGGGAGTSGSGGGAASGSGTSYHGSGGAGWNGNGGAGSSATAARAINSLSDNQAGFGGQKTVSQAPYDGGYGGGGATGDYRQQYTHGGGGGGGYSGGAGGYYEGSPGGGGSYALVSGSSYRASKPCNHGNGSVTVAYLGKSLGSYSSSVAGLSSNYFDTQQDFIDVCLAQGAINKWTSSMKGHLDTVYSSRFLRANSDNTEYGVIKYGVRTILVQTPSTRPSGTVWGGRYTPGGAYWAYQETYGGGIFCTSDSNVDQAAYSMIGPNNVGLFQIRIAGGRSVDLPSTQLSSTDSYTTDSYGTYDCAYFSCIARYN